MNIINKTFSNLISIQKKLKSNKKLFLLKIKPCISNKVFATFSKMNLLSSKKRAISSLFLRFPEVNFCTTSYFSLSILSVISIN